MKKKSQIAVLLAFAAFLIVSTFLIPNSEYYEKYKPYKYAYFPNYSTINNKLSEKDMETAAPIIETAREVFTFVGEEKPEKDVGKLDRYYRIEEGIADIELEIEAVAGDFSWGNGYLWVVYSVTRKTESGDTHSGSWDILSYWKLKETDGKWEVVQIKEAV